MSTCYVLGAGFSREMAGLPVMRDLVASFRARHRRECEKGRGNRVAWGATVLEFIDSLESEAVHQRMVGGDERCESCDFTEDFEAILSFIDLNVGRTIEATIVSSAGEKSSRSRACPFSNYMNLQEIRYYIATYLRLVLEEPSAIKADQIERFANCLAMGDSILTFNYDLVVEKELWRQRRWSPSDGYGVDFRPSQSVAEAAWKSCIQVYKLHGSLNWRSPGFFESLVKLEGFHDNGEPIFPGYLDDETSPHEYQGGHAPCWVMPSFIKDFSVPELLGVWGRGQEALRQATDVVVIGYSLPEADSAACLLLGTAGIAQKRLTIVDPNVKALCGKFERITRNTNIACFSAIQDYIDARLAGRDRV